MITKSNNQFQNYEFFEGHKNWKIISLCFDVTKHVISKNPATIILLTRFNHQFQNYDFEFSQICWGSVLEPTLVYIGLVPIFFLNLPKSLKIDWCQTRANILSLEPIQEWSFWLGISLTTELITDFIRVPLPYQCNSLEYIQNLDFKFSNVHSRFKFQVGDSNFSTILPSDKKGFAFLLLAIPQLYIFHTDITSF